MRKVNPFIAYFAAIFLLCSCGGVIGNIEKYPFPNVNPGSLKQALNRVYNKYPQLTKPDSNMYGKNNGDDFYYFVDHEGQKTVFQCNVVVYPAPYDKQIDLSLTTATDWGKTMQLATKMGFFEKRKYRKLLEENILPKIEEEIVKK